jgi:O-methyltransferase involved in polyketide biosynthesis
MSESSTPAGGQEEAPKLDTSTPHSARVWNYWLGGTDNFPADREVGDQVRAIYPEIAETARASRAFLARAVQYLVGAAGIRQFLDIGSGLPTTNNIHEVAQAVAPECRVVYVDNDPLVLMHARALLTSAPEGATDYIDADVHDLDTILQAAGATLDFTRPIALVMQGILGYVVDDNEARSIVKRLLDAVPSGSYLVLGDGTKSSDVHAEIERVLQEGGLRYARRSPEQFARLFAGVELLEPGVVFPPQWRPDPNASDGLTAEGPGRVGVGRKP